MEGFGADSVGSTIEPSGHTNDIVKGGTRGREQVGKAHTLHLEPQEPWTRRRNTKITKTIKKTITTLGAHFKYLNEHEKANAQKEMARLVESLPVDYKQKKNGGVPEAKNVLPERKRADDAWVKNYRFSGNGFREHSSGPIGPDDAYDSEEEASF